jgi:hypothetical protein
MWYFRSLLMIFSKVNYKIPGLMAERSNASPVAIGVLFDNCDKRQRKNRYFFKKDGTKVQRHR